jgi:hypothetical protein
MRISFPPQAYRWAGIPLPSAGDGEGRGGGYVPRGAGMIATNEKDKFRSKITGRVYNVKKIVDEMIVLESVNGTSQVLTELNNIALFYERELKNDEDQG